MCWFNAHLSRELCILFLTNEMGVDGYSPGRLYIPLVCYLPLCSLFQTLYWWSHHTCLLFCWRRVFRCGIRHFSALPLRRSKLYLTTDGFHVLYILVDHTLQIESHSTDQGCIHQRVSREARGTLGERQWSNKEIHSTCLYFAIRL